MSYAVAAALQAAVYQRLTADAALSGTAIYDAVPPGTGPGTFVTIGPEDVRDRSDKSGHGAEHRLVISVVSDAAGFQEAKVVAAAVSEALVDAELVLARGRLIGLGFLRAVARRTENGTGRRIDLTFRARVEE
jgi:Ni,Fe-hydrogenase maturation factor